MKVTREFEIACVAAADEVGKVHAAAGSAGRSYPFNFRAQRLFQEIRRIKRGYDIDETVTHSGIHAAVNQLKTYFPKQDHKLSHPDIRE